MSLQWTFVAGFLYFEIIVAIIMMLPIFSPRRWHQFLKSRLFSMFHERTIMYFYVLLGVLCMFLLDAIREMRKYSQSSADMAHINLSSELKGNVKLFRAQRNFYITGFSIFLAFVIKRLGTMLLIQHELTMKAQNIIKEAESTVKLAKNTVLANAIQSEDLKHFEEVKDLLKTTEQLLNEEKVKAKSSEHEATMWKLKYEELSSKLNGKGDEI